jgi:hypothetical protein
MVRAAKKTEKVCFLICPIGEPNSEERKRSDQIRDIFLKDVLAEFNYKVNRADDYNKSGVITNQIIEKLVNDDLVIADLSGHNPNVFYELAIRHAAKKPFIHIINEGEDIPFDISPVRAVPYNLQDYQCMVKAKDTLKDMIKDIERSKSPITNPVTLTMAILDFNNKTSDTKLTKALNTVVSSVQELYMTSERTYYLLRDERRRIPTRIYYDIKNILDQIAEIIDKQECTDNKTLLAILNMLKNLHKDMLRDSRYDIPADVYIGRSINIRDPFQIEITQKFDTLIAKVADIEK